jgi:hypothetical protein
MTEVKIKASENTSLVRDKGNTTECFLFDGNGPSDSSVEHKIPKEGTRILVERSRNPLYIKVKQGNTDTIFAIKHTISKYCYYNILNYGIGMVLDHNKINKFSYPAHLFINKTDNGQLYLSRFEEYKKHAVSGLFSLSMLNLFGYNVKGEKYTAAGILGVSAGAEYQYGEHSAVSLQMGISGNITMGEQLGDTVSAIKASSAFVNAKNNTMIGRFTVGYGLSLYRHAYHSNLSIRDSGTTTRRDVPIADYTNLKLGTVITAHYRLRNKLHVGMVYQPSFISFNSAFASKYEYLINFELLWKFH